MQYILSLSYGKDSIACLEAIKQLGLPLDRIIHAEVWATDTIPADLPPMVEFKQKADKIIKERYGISVEHVCAVDADGENRMTYERVFYRRYEKGKHTGEIYGFPILGGGWCESKLKSKGFRMMASKSVETQTKQRLGIDFVQYLGIAADEPERIKRHTRRGIVLPLVEIGWDEAYCRKWCEDNGLLSPLYETSSRGGCWFCHNQGVAQLRHLRKNYPELWQLLLKWDSDSPVIFKMDGKTVHDYDVRFRLEEQEIIPIDHKFRWAMLKDENLQV